MIFICNTGPLIALAKIHQLFLLQDLGPERILIPPTVHKELWGKIGPESLVIEAALNSFIHVVQLGQIDQRVEEAVIGLDNGEREVIVLGTLLHEDVVLLIDDQAGRRAAGRLGISVLGTVGLLLLAKQRGFVEKVGPLIAAIRAQGYWLSDTLVTQAKGLAGEQDT